MEKTLALIPLLPLIGFVINGLVGKRLSRLGVALIGCAGPMLGFILASRVFDFVATGGTIEVVLYTWIESGALTIDLAFVADRLTAVMLLVVTGVGTLIHVYSAEYMETEDQGGYARYFAYLNLFTAMMLVLVTGANLPMLFIGWEGVGLCSYLLIGFWYKDTKNCDAGRKAFIVNRVGDFGFLLGIFVLFFLFGELSFEGINAQAEQGLREGQQLGVTIACLFLFLGACGKSAQIPLHVWLPDAMAGPTPVSALTHAATMVTAGVYMVARLGGLFSAAPIALTVIAVVGVVTAFFAATMALTENDLKKVLAYSTISQLGYMFLGVGTGVYAAGIFHLVTHAFFKALLFLAAGAVMHAMHHMDMRRFGGLKDKMPATYWLFLIGALGLAGIPPFSGFFSKDEVLAMTFGKYLDGDGVYWLVIWIAGVATAGLTAFYTFRAFALTFHGEPRGPKAEHAHAHDPGGRILGPLAILAALAAFGGFLNVSPLFGGHAGFFHFLAPVLGEVPHGGHSGAAWFAVAVTTGLGVLCAYSAFWIYTRRPDLPARVVERPGLGGLYRLASQKYRIDELYRVVFVEPIVEGARSLWRGIDVGVIDNTVNGVASVARSTAAFVRRSQAGPLGQYTFYLAGGAIAVVLLVIFGGP